MAKAKKETQADLKRRLIELGWWSEAVRLREKVKAEAIKANPALTQQEAAKLGWQKVAEQYPPGIPRASGPSPTSTARAEVANEAKEAEIRRVTADKAPSSKREDFEWVYQNIGNKAAVDWTTAPGAGARGLLEWAIDRKDKFYDLYFAKFNSKNEDGSKHTNEGPTNLIDELLQQSAEGIPGELVLSPVDVEEGGG